MLGAKLGHEAGKVTAQTVVRSRLNPLESPRMETTFRATGTLLGVDETDTVTFWTVVRPDGTVYGEGQGIVMGIGPRLETATFLGQGVGTIQEDGTISYRGATYYQSSTPKWSRLNKIAAVFELEVSPTGKTKSANWEWK